MLLQTLGWLPVSVLGYNWSLGCPAQMEISASKDWDESNPLHKETEGYTFSFLSKIDHPFRMLLFWVAQHFSRQVSLFFLHGVSGVCFQAQAHCACLVACHRLTGLTIACMDAMPFCHSPSFWERSSELPCGEGGRHGPWKGNDHSML